MDSDVSQRIRRLFGLITISFLVLIAWQSYWHLIKSDWLQAQPANPRVKRAEVTTPRGAIYDRQGRKIAWSEGGNRKYAVPRATAAVIGFVDRQYGRSGVERVWDLELAGLSTRFTLDELRRMQRGEKPSGKDLVVTLDLELQQAALKALGNHRGAVAVVEPASGAILALATSPTFSAENVYQQYAGLSERDDGVLRNRAVQDHYAPGSTMKVLTAAAALKHGVDPETRYTCEGKTPLGRFTITDYHGTAHGSIDMTTALVKSCNYYFARTAVELSARPFFTTAEGFGFGRDWWNQLPEPRMLPLSIADSTLTSNMGPKVPDRELAHMGFGQSTVVATPLQMAMICAGIANEGTVMAPYLVAEVKKAATGQILQRYESVPVGYPLNRDTASIVASMMRRVVTGGTGSRANVRGLTVYGKTGTAEQEGGDDHAWFVGFAEHERGDSTQEIAFAVVIERGGTGGRVAAPVARAVLETWARQE